MKNNSTHWNKLAGIYFIVLIFTIFSTYPVIGQTTNSIHVVNEQIADSDPFKSIALPEIEFENGVPIFPWARPVVILKGSDFEMGYQYSVQLSHIFGDWILKLIKYKFSPEQYKALKGYEYYIKKYAPEMIEYFKGMTSGANDLGVDITYEEALAQFCFGVENSGEYKPPDPEQENFPEELDEIHRCGSCAAWGSMTKDGEVITSSSSDGADHFNVTIICFPDSGNAYIHSPYYAVGPWVSAGGHSGMNDKGVVYVHHGVTESAQSMGKKPRYGIQSDIAIRHTLRFANDADEAVKMTLTYETTGDYFGGGYYGTGGFWIDKSSNAFIIERSNPPAIIRKPGDSGEKDFIYATNTLLSKELGKEGQEYIEHGGWLKKGTPPLKDFSVSRNLYIYNLFNDYRGQIDLEFIKMVWRYQGNPVKEYGGPDTWDENFRNHLNSDNESNYWKTIGHIANACVTITIPKKNLYLVSTTFATRYPNVIHPEDIHWHRWLAYPTRAFYRLFLGDSPRDVMKAAKYQAEIDLYLADRELRKLSIHDPAYSYLDKILNQAIIEWTKGDFWRGNEGLESTLTIKADEEASIYYWAKATRSFTRCQLLARKVYYALVPQALKPSDLGLQPWNFQLHE